MIAFRIHTSFWITASFIAFLNSSSILEFMLGVAVVFFSTLVHELGHALMGVFYGRSAVVELTAWGGLAYNQQGNSGLSWGQRFVQILAGPLAGFLLYFCADYTLHLIPRYSRLPHELFYFLACLRYVNLYWSFLNLIPVEPLDGGKLLKMIMERVWQETGRLYFCLVSAIIAFAAGLFMLIRGSQLFCFFLLFWAYQSFELYRQLRRSWPVKKQVSLHKLLDKACSLAKRGEVEEAQKTLALLRQKAGRGHLYHMATQYAAFIHYDLGDKKSAWVLLKEVRSHIEGDGLLLFARLASEFNEYELLPPIAARCFKEHPTVEVALSLAKASAIAHNIEATVGWLKAAIRGGFSQLTTLLNEPCFALVKESPAITKLLKEPF